VAAKRIAAVVASLAALMLAATAWALAPKSGSYKGLTSGPVMSGFAPPVSFTLPSKGKELTSFKYSTFGCGGFGGVSERGGDHYLMPYAVKNIGKVPLTSTGTFSIRNVKTTYRVRGKKTVTTTSISGKFTSSTKAAGTITFSQTFRARGHTIAPCGPSSVTFSATRK
jgi:hypothetical protein